MGGGQGSVRRKTLAEAQRRRGREYKGNMEGGKDGRGKRMKRRDGGFHCPLTTDN